MGKVTVADGKYTVVDELSEGGGFYALRYGEQWRSLSGDQLVYAMYCEIKRLREHLREVADLILPNESEYKCDYRREWALSKIQPEGVVDDD